MKCKVEDIDIRQDLYRTMVLGVGNFPLFIDFQILGSSCKQAWNILQNTPYDELGWIARRNY